MQSNEHQGQTKLSFSSVCCKVFLLYKKLKTIGLSDDKEDSTDDKLDDVSLEEVSLDKGSVLVFERSMLIIDSYSVHT